MTADPKATARKAAFTVRKAAHARASSVIGPATGHLLTAIGPAKNRVVAGYMPIRTEISPRPAMGRLHAQGARICVPVITGQRQPLKFREWAPDCTMIDGPFGAQVPETGDWLFPDIVIVPLVAFDRQFHRLGYGGGFYDRTLEHLRNAGPVRALGFAYSAQELPEIPQEPTDQALDALITETGPLPRPKPPRKPCS